MMGLDSAKVGEKKELINKGFFAFIAKAISAGASFLMSVFVARSLGVEESGYFFLSLTLITVLSMLCLQGYNNILVRFIASYKAEVQPGKITTIYNITLVKVFGASIFCSAIVYFSSGWISSVVFGMPGLTTVLAVMSLSILPLAICQHASFCFQGTKSVASAMMFRNGVVPIVFILLALSLSYLVDLDFSGIFLLSSLFGSVLAVLIFTRQNNVNLTETHFSDSVLEDIRPIQLDMFLVIVLGLVIQWSSQLIVGVFLSPEDIAYFSTAQRTAMLTSFILVAVNSIVAPKFASAYASGNKDRLRFLSIYSSRMLFIVATPVLFFIIFFAEFIMSFFGAGFTEGANILRVLALGQFINVATGSVGYLLQMTGLEKDVRNNMVISGIILLTLSPLLTVQYGVIGGALATAIAVSTQNILCVYKVYLKLGFNTLAIWKKL
ncbi:oligosaccharide flippase family protein [Marinobacter hydrocarbonoclasticus]|nr:oligosaccharide flippase family protein [Marinobacter nauticus]